VATKFGKTSWQTFEDQASVAFRSAVLLCQAFLPAMAKQRAGKVVFMLSSNTVLQPAPKYSAAYMSAKYALLGLMKALSAEYADKGVAVNAVSPSMIDTKFLADVPELIVRRNAEESPLGRNLVTADVAPVFDFLLSDGADCITGQNIAVTAGN
jgi:3-oxoacyl-[acyl-carrier protein] reductase